MRTFLLLSSILAFILPLPTLAGVILERTIPVDSEYRLVLTTVKGKITLLGSTDPVLGIEARTSETLDPGINPVSVEVDETAKLITIKVLEEEDGLWASLFDKNTSPSISFTLRLPNLQRVELRTVSADLEGSNLTGTIEFRTVSGDVSLEGTMSASGRSVSGDISVRHLATDLSPTLTYKTISGDIKLHLPSTSSSKVLFSTVSGSFLLNGEDLADPEDGKVLRLGEGTSRIEVKTVSGDLELSCPSCTVTDRPPTRRRNQLNILIEEEEEDEDEPEGRHRSPEE